MKTRNNMSAARWVGAMATVAVAVVAIAFHNSVPRTDAVVGAAPPGSGTPSSACVGVVIVSSAEKAPMLVRLAAAYDSGKPTIDGRCVDVRVNRGTSGVVIAALGRGWDERSDGPQPVVWSPPSSSWLLLLQNQARAHDQPDLVPAESTSLMESPLILAMPRPMAEALGWPNAPVGWADILKLGEDPQGWGRYGHPEWGPFRLGKTSPLLSTSGLHSLLAAYYAATGVSSDLTAANVEDPRVIAFVRGIEQTVLHYGSTVQTFFDALKASDQRGEAMQYVSAIATEEQELIAYNVQRPKTRLAAIYPRDGTVIDDHPYAILQAPWVSDSQRIAAAAFEKWLLQPEQQQTFMAAGFRDHDGKIGSAFDAGNGIITSPALHVIKPPAPEVLALIRDSWGNVRKRARVLVVLDTSGSMDGTKIDAMRSAAKAALGQFSDSDSVGLWEFNSDIHELAPMDPIGSSRKRLDAAIDGLQANGATVLYTVTWRAVSDVQQTWNPNAINAVMLLTDGQNDDTQNGDLDGLVQKLSSQSLEHRVPVFTIGYGSDADMSALQRISTASGGKAYDAPDPSQIVTVFADVISNF